MERKKKGRIKREPGYPEALMDTMQSQRPVHPTVFLVTSQTTVIPTARITYDQLERASIFHTSHTRIPPLALLSPGL